MPWYQCGSGGIDQVTSSVSSATSASASPRSSASAYPVTISPQRARRRARAASAAASGAGPSRRRPAGPLQGAVHRRGRRVHRRWRSRRRRSRAPRTAAAPPAGCPAGAGSAATNASSTASRCSYVACGPTGPAPSPHRGRGPARRPRPSGASPTTARSLDGPRSTGSARLPRLFDGVQAGAGGDGVEPRAQRAAALEARDPAPRPQQGVLQRVVGVVRRAEHAVAVRVQLPAQRFHETGERGVVTRPRPGEAGLLVVRRGPVHGLRDVLAHRR